MPKATVAAINTKKKDGRQQVLLARRNTEPFKNFLSLPGGHIDPYEPAKDAIIREVLEELGLDFAPEFQFYNDEIIPERGIHAVVGVFVGQAVGKIDLSSGEISEVIWTDLNETPNLPLAFLHAQILTQYALAIQ